MADFSYPSPPPTPSRSQSLFRDGGPAPMLFPPLPSTVGDRFIPVRSAMNWGVANYLLTHKPEPVMAVSPSKRLYSNLLKHALDIDTTRILAFHVKPPGSMQGHVAENYSCPIKLFPDDEAKDCPDAVEHYMVNCLDWSCRNIIAIALGSGVYLYNAATKSVTELRENDVADPVTCLSWDRDGQLLAVGSENSDKIELWDVAANSKLRPLRIHTSGVLSLAWNGRILTCGCNNGKIYNCDVSNRSCIKRRRYSSHGSKVCCLKWASSGSQLASGGADGNLLIWDQRTTSCRNGWLYRFGEFDHPVNTISWSPFESNLLASGGGDGSSMIKFWNTKSGLFLSSFDTGAEVCDLLWSQRKGELFTAHGLSQNNFVQWKYPSMAKMAKLIGHSSSVLSIAQSPDGCRVASIEKDEVLRFWTISGMKETAKPKNIGPFASQCYIR